MHAPTDVRLRLARAAFPGMEIELDPYAYTVDMLRAREWDDPVFLVGADQLAAFASWKEPEAVLELARLGVATRPGIPRCAAEPSRASSISRRSTCRPAKSARRVAEGEAVDELVPPAVAGLIEELGVYRR